jgi:general secretion pathway protein G
MSLFCQRRRRGGLTLIEIMVVIVVLGILATFIVTSVAGKDEQARVAKARSDVATLTTQLENFKLDVRRYPTEEEGLGALREPPQGEDANLWKGPYSRTPIPNDPWDQPYHYIVPAPNGIDPFGVESYGADKAPGGDGYNQDIQSWANYKENDKSAQQ